MCGIFIVIQKNSQITDQQRTLYSRALSDLSFRGPDLKIEKIINENIYFGQTILSLVGNVKHSTGQHLISSSKKFHIAFNGEIYNYQELHQRYLKNLSFHLPQTTDTEVLVNLHDQLTPNKIPYLLDGMYAYTLFDTENNILYLNRDPQGEKTLYVLESSERIIISSEIQAIKRVQKLTLDAQVLRDYFCTRHFMFEARTLYPEVRQLLPGQLQSLELKNFSWKTVDHLTLKHFIEPEIYQKNKKRTLDDLTDELDQILSHNIGQMIPFQRDFASVISGGIDSSLITAYAVMLGNPKKLIAVNHLGKDQISHDLKKFEKILNRPIDIVNVDQVVYARALVACQKTLSAPIFSHSFVGQSLQSQFVRSNGCVAMFGGEGADELFGGYGTYLNAPSSNQHLFSPSTYTSYTETNLFKNNQHDILKQELGTLWQKSQNNFSHISDLRERMIQSMMFADLSYQLPAVGLRGADLMSMMWSVETRSIFLRRDIIRFALNLPLNFKLDFSSPDSNLSTKKILKNLFIRKFGPELILPKQGFAGFPNEAGVYLGLIENYLALDFLDMDKNQVLKKNLSYEAHWKLINIEYYLRQNIA